MNIYIATALTHVPRELFDGYSECIHGLAARIKSSIQGANVKYALINSDPQLALRKEEAKAALCYKWDAEMVEASDLIIAEVSFPSTGLGIELQIAKQKNIPVILIFKDFGTNRAPEKKYRNPDNKNYDLQIGEGFISLMVLGLPNVKDIIQYKDMDECARLV